MKIEELTGKLIDGRAETVTLFEFKLTGDTEKDAKTGKVKEIFGYFQQVNPISEKLIQSFYSVGITKEELAPYINPPAVIEGRSNLASQVDAENKRFESMKRLHGESEVDDGSPSFL